MFYPSESDNFPKGPYESFAAFSADFDKWRAETFQTFVKANGSNKVAESHQYALLSYRKIKFSCIHHGTYLPKGKGERVFTHSRANNCPAFLDPENEYRFPPFFHKLAVTAWLTQRPWPLILRSRRKNPRMRNGWTETSSGSGLNSSCSTKTF